MRIDILKVTLENADGIAITLNLRAEYGVKVGDSVMVTVNHSEIVKRIISIECIQLDVHEPYRNDDVLKKAADLLFDSAIRAKDTAARVTLNSGLSLDIEQYKKNKKISDVVKPS